VVITVMHASAIDINAAAGWPNVTSKTQPHHILNRPHAVPHTLLHFPGEFHHNIAMLEE
jgi:hypothetical protein